MHEEPRKQGKNSPKETMRNDLILASIKDYISSSSTGYALMINGPWGSGKTYFWRSRVEPAIKSLNKEPVYVSLYGLTKAEDIDSLIVLAMYPILRRKGVKMAWTAIGTGLRRFGIDLSKFDLSTFKGSLANTVLCFDDMERCSAKLDIEDIMGQINRYVEHENVKTLLIANEEEIGQGDAEKRQRYAKIKEKLIGLTFPVEADIGGAVDAALNNLHPATRTTCLQHRPYIENMAERNPAFNVRSLNLALHYYDTVTRRLHTDKEFYRVSFVLLRLILWSTIEIKKNGANARRLKPLFDAGANVSASLYFNQNDPEKTYLSDWLTLADIGDEAGGLSFRSVFDLVVTGILDEQQLRSEYDATIRRITTPAKTEESLFEGQFFKLDDVTFQRLVQQKLDDLRNDRVTKGHELVPLAQHFFYFSEQQLIAESDATLRDLFVATIQRQADAGTLDLQYVNLHGSLFVVNDLNNAAYLEIKNLLLKLAESHSSRRRAEAIRVAFDELLINFDEALRVLSDEQSPTFQGTLFDVIGGDRLVQIIDALSPWQIMHFSGWIRRRFAPVNIMEYYAAEVPALQRFVDVVDARPRQRPIDLHAHSVVQIASQITSALKRPMPQLAH